jgi:hypothetical protein
MKKTFSCVLAVPLGGTGMPARYAKMPWLEPCDLFTDLSEIYTLSLQLGTIEELELEIKDQGNGWYLCYQNRVPDN